MLQIPGVTQGETARPVCSSLAFDLQLPETLNVLLVEDDELNMLVMKSCLSSGFHERFGTNISVAHEQTAEGALKLIDGKIRCPFDIIVVDQHMEPAGGVMKGAQLVQNINVRPYAQPPLLVLASGNGDNPSERELFLQCGASVVWPKPYPEPAQMVNDIVLHLPACRKTGARVRE